MFYDFDQSRGGFILRKNQLLFMPEMKALYDAFGWDALQYLHYFSSPISPYFYSPVSLRDSQCRDAIAKQSWEQGRTLPAHLYENPVYRLAEKKFLEHDVQIEADQEATLFTLRNETLKHIKSLSIKQTAERKEIIELLGALETVSKQHRENKKALTDRILADDGVAISAFDV